MDQQFLFTIGDNRTAIAQRIAEQQHGLHTPAIKRRWICRVGEVVVLRGIGNTNDFARISLPFELNDLADFETDFGEAAAIEAGQFRAIGGVFKIELAVAVDIEVTAAVEHSETAVGALHPECLSQFTVGKTCALDFNVETVFGYCNDTIFLSVLTNSNLQ